LCSGSANQVFDASTTHYVGTRTKSASWTRTADAIDYWEIPTGNAVAAKRVSTTWTEGSAFNGGEGVYWYRKSEAAAGHATLFIVEIAKGTPNFTLKLMYPGPASESDQNASLSDLMTQIVAGTPSKTGSTWSSGVTIACSESDGTLDHVTVGWDRSEATFTVFDIVISKIA